MTLDALICTNFDKFKNINPQIGHIKTTKLYVKLSYLTRMSPAKITIVDICNQINISERSFHRYTFRLFVQGLLENKTEFDCGTKSLYIALPKSAPKLTINFRKLKKLTELTGNEDEAMLLSHIAYETKYKHGYHYSIREIGQIFCWGKMKTIKILKQLEAKKFIEMNYENAISRTVKINHEQIKNIKSVDNFSKPVDNFAKSVDKSVDKSKIPKSYPQLNCQKRTTKLPETDNLDPYIYILRNIRRNIIINTEPVEGSVRSTSYERTLRMFFVNEEFLEASLERLKASFEVGWETAEWLAQIRYSVLKTMNNKPESNVLNLLCLCIKLAVEKKWGVPSGFYQSEEGRKYYEHIERQMLEHEERKWGVTAPDNRLLEMLHQKLPHMASRRPP